MALDLGLFVAPIRLLANGKYQIAPVPAPAAEEKPASTTTYKFGGYAKFDSMFTDYSDSAPSGNSLMRQFYYAPKSQSVTVRAAAI